MNLRKEIKPRKKKTSAPSYQELACKSVVITGKHPTYTRSALEGTLFDRYGIEVNNNVTAKTDFILVGSRPGQSKLKKARHYGIREISITDLIP